MRTCLLRSSDASTRGSTGREKLECPGGNCEGVRPADCGGGGNSTFETITDGTFERSMGVELRCQLLEYSSVISSKLYCEAIDTSRVPG